MANVVHLTSVHSRYDIRIFRKQCCSLARMGGQVSLVVADGNGDEVCNGVRIYDVGASRGRIDRIFNSTKRVFDKAFSLSADVYHVHDPELIPIALKLKRRKRARIVFDSHEDVPKQMLGKPYLNRYFRYVFSIGYEVYEKLVCGKFDAIVAATPFIKEKFRQINSLVVDINNYPMLGELDQPLGSGVPRSDVCYVGGISENRGVREVVRALESVMADTRLVIAGTFSEPGVESEVRQYPGWARVEECGFVDRNKVREILARSFAGVVTFWPSPNHIDAQPNKMFEYMSAGVPVIASDFPLWREIVLENDCGLCVDPLNPQAIAQAIDSLANNPEQVVQMGENGRRAVREKYNWENEELKLLALYQSIIK